MDSVISSGRTLLCTMCCCLTAATASAQATYPVVDTRQVLCYDTVRSIACRQPGEPFFGQDAQHDGLQPDYSISGDRLTALDNVTGLTWQRSPDLNDDGSITAADKLTWPQAQQRPAALNAARFGGYDDWRLPAIKELYSLIMFNGTDPAVQGSDTRGLTPFIDTTVFRFAYGDVAAGERIIDAQYASSTLYMKGGAPGGSMLFGVNFADGRIKGYGLRMMGGAEKTFLVQCVRGNPSYGHNDFADNGDGTVSDRATGLMWAKADAGTALNWREALAWAEARNAERWLGHSDWRLPDAKELESIVDYSRSPDETQSPAIDTVFACTPITNEAGQADFPCYWTSTSHASFNGGAAAAVYVAFGRAMGYMDGAWRDVHGAGAQRSDPKSGNPADFPTGRGPQGDAIRIFNHLRLVRGGSGTTDIGARDAASPAAAFGFRSFPNPLRAGSAISFAAFRPCELSLAVLDVRGRLVKLLHEGETASGMHAATWDGTDRRGLPAAAGTYFLRLSSGTETLTRAVLYLGR